jgi:hypothetical protein
MMKRNGRNLRTCDGPIPSVKSWATEPHWGLFVNDFAYSAIGAFSVFTGRFYRVDFGRADRLNVAATNS